MSIRKKCIILNANSKGGNALDHWKRVRPILEKQYGPFSVHVSKEKKISEVRIRELIEKGERAFISAGGDGCANLLINTIIVNKKQTRLSDFTVGALGLGSSNDYHKPYSEKVGNIPVRMNDTRPILRDVGEILYRNSKEDREIYFLISASTGIVADGNANFNRGGRVLDFLKKRWTDLAIFWTFFQTLRTFRNIPMVLKVDADEELELNVSYLAVSKTPYISGMFHFDGAISKDDGRFMVKILHDCTKWDLIRCMIKLMSGNEEGMPNLLTRFVKTLEVSSSDAFTLECDGETQKANNATFKIYKERVKECV